MYGKNPRTDVKKLKNDFPEIIIQDCLSYHITLFQVILKRHQTIKPLQKYILVKYAVKWSLPKFEDNLDKKSKCFFEF